MWYVIPLAIILDQLTKFWVVRSMHPYESKTLIDGFLSLTYVPNSGAFFGILQEYNNVLAVTALIVACGIIVFLWTRKDISRQLNFALTLIVGGAIGNIIDRLLHNAVVDFISFQFIDFPIFNLADVTISIGAVLMIIHVIRGSKTNGRA